MCGIYGRFQFQEALNLDGAIDSLNTLRHRGPDGFGIEYGNYQDNTFSLLHNALPPPPSPANTNYFIGHRRLSIIDLGDNAFQPMESNSKKYSITFNGEIYNYIELKSELLALGYSFNTDHSDTEVLLASYETWGAGCVKKLRGMYAFAVYDRINNSVFIARDRIGQKPLYYEINENQFTFASELSALLSKNEKHYIDKTALNLYLALGYIPHPHCIYAGVNKLPPAHYAVIDLNDHSIEIVEYWDIEAERHKSNSNDELAQTKKSIEESVRFRLRSDVSVGAFISGGIDSTIIVKYISNVVKQPLDIYGADFPGTNRSEKKYILKATEKYQQKLSIVEIDNSKIANIESIVKVFDEPFDGASAIALFDLFDVASKSHKVILTGDGGDEMFAGYDRYREFPEKMRTINALKRLGLPKLIAKFCLALGIFRKKSERILWRINSDLFENYNGINGTSDLSALLKAELAIDQLSKLPIFRDTIARAKQKNFSATKTLQYIELKTILPGRMLYKLDRFSMHYGVEARSPFLDHELAQKAFSLPDNICIEGNSGKAVLKHILLEDFSRDFVYRKKSGFGNPLDRWLSSNKASSIFAILLNEDSRIYQFLDYKKTLAAFPELLDRSKIPRTKLVWRLLVLAHFLKSNKVKRVS